MSYQDPASTSAAAPSAEERQWGMLAHLLALSGFIIPFGNLLAPLIVWQVKKETMPFVADQAKEALNFNITMSIAGIVAGLLVLVLIGFVLLPIIGLAWIILTIMAGLKANEGQQYRYPFTLRLIS